MFRSSTICEPAFYWIFWADEKSGATVGGGGGGEGGFRPKFEKYCLLFLSYIKACNNVKFKLSKEVGNRNLLSLIQLL